MALDWCSKNGVIIPAGEAVVPVSCIEYAYGFGVYETVRVVHGTPLFLGEHIARLLHSAKLIDLEHTISITDLEHWTTELLKRNAADSCNIKILLVGGRTAEEATLWMLPLSPHFPEKRLFTQGILVITAEHERFLPQVKSLNMLPSYLFYRKAKLAGCYDALLVNRDGCITEGTRTNILALRGRQIISPPAADILEGVTRTHVLEVAKQNGFTYAEEHIALSNISAYDGFCLTSTSSKILPIARIDEKDIPIPETLRELMQHFGTFLDAVRE